MADNGTKVKESIDKKLPRQASIRERIKSWQKKADSSATIIKPAPLIRSKSFKTMQVAKENLEAENNELKKTIEKLRRTLAGEQQVNKLLNTKVGNLAKNNDQFASQNASFKLEIAELRSTKSSLSKQNLKLMDEHKAIITSFKELKSKENMFDGMIAALSQAQDKLDELSKLPYTELGIFEEQLKYQVETYMQLNRELHELNFNRLEKSGSKEEQDALSDKMLQNVMLEQQLTDFFVKRTGPNKKKQQRILKLKHAIDSFAKKNNELKEQIRTIALLEKSKPKVAL